MSGTEDSAGREPRPAGASLLEEGFFPFLRPRLTGLIPLSLHRLRYLHATDA